MNREEIENRVRASLIDDLEIDAELLTPNARMKEDVGIDSLDAVDLVVIVERDFGIKIKTEELHAIATLGDFYNYIETRLNK